MASALATGWILLLANVALMAAPELGYVVESKGPWVDRKYGNRPLSGGRLIYTDSEVVLAEASPRSYLTLRLVDQSVKTYNCREAGVCTGVVKLPALPEKPTGFLAFVLGVLTREGPPAVELSSRGAEVRDDVAVIQGGRVDLRTVLEAAARERYDGGWCAEPPGSPCQKPQTSFVLDCRAAGQTVLAPAPPRGGLARLLVKMPGEDWSAASEAWVLAAAEPKASQWRAKLSEVRKETAGWSPQDPNFPLLLRAYLRELAAQ